MDEIVKKLAGLGLPGVILVVLTVASGGSSAAVAAAITALGGAFWHRRRYRIAWFNNRFGRYYSGIWN